MKIYPAIDLKAGACVRLYQGDYEKVTTYAENPLLMASTFMQQGATFLHVVDLDGAKKGESVNLDVVIKIVQATGLHIQMGGGIRTHEQVKNLIKHGIARVIVGSIAISDIDTVKAWIKEFGPERIVLALDVQLNGQGVPELATHGWQMNSQISLWDLLEKYLDSGLQHVLCTDIERDGTLTGPNFSLYKECVEHYPQLQFQASGGISSLDDLRQLAVVPMAGAIIGKALYENKFTVREAVAEVAKC